MRQDSGIGVLDKAVGVLNAVATSPGSWLVHLKMASIYYDEGSIDKAEREYRKVIELDRVSSPAYAGLGYGKASFPVSERMAQEVLSLPIGPHLSASEQESVFDCVLQARPA